MHKKCIKMEYISLTFWHKFNFYSLYLKCCTANIFFILLPVRNYVFDGLFIISKLIFSIFFHLFINVVDPLRMRIRFYINPELNVTPKHNLDPGPRAWIIRILPSYSINIKSTKNTENVNCIKKDKLWSYCNKPNFVCI